MEQTNIKKTAKKLENIFLIGFMCSGKTIIGGLIGLGIIITVLVVLRMPKISSTRHSDDKNIENEIIKPGEFHGNELDKKMNCTFENVDLFEINSLSKCDLSREIAMGVEVNFSFKESRRGKSRRFSFQVLLMSKRKILDEIIRRNPGYYWKEKNGVINIRPLQTDNNSKTVSPLDMTIPRFEVHQIPPYFALEYLRQLAWKHNIPITTGSYEVAIQIGGKLPDSSGKLKHPEHYDAEQLIDVIIPHKVSIRDCLNAIVLANPPANWNAIKWKDGKTALFLHSFQRKYSHRKH
ncbi:MAG: hypothetical protein KAJ48_09780 [Elusimicrobiales bacterium]|nr:hypothetical protein [Elusimicrobiales bacterium]